MAKKSGIRTFRPAEKGEGPSRSFVGYHRPTEGQLYFFLDTRSPEQTILIGMQSISHGHLVGT